jgi:hypothetical protein
MLSRDSQEPDDPKFAHEVAAGIIARAQKKFSVNSGSSNGDRIRIDAAKSASELCLKLETVSSLLLAPSTSSSSADSKFKPEIERIKYKVAQLKNKAEIHAKQSADVRHHQSPKKTHSSPKKENGDNNNFCINEIEMKRLAMSELTKIPVKILEKRLHGLSDRLIRHLSPERTNSCSAGTTPSFNQLSPKSGNDSPITRTLAYSPQNSNRCGAIPRADSKSLKDNWLVGSSLATCGAVVMAIAFCSRINELYSCACARRDYAARKIQHKYLIHLFRHFYERSRKKRSAFFVLVRSLRKYVRRWRLRKRIRCVHYIRQFLTSVKLRRKFNLAVKHKLKMVGFPMYFCQEPVSRHSRKMTQFMAICYLPSNHQTSL